MRSTKITKVKSKKAKCGYTYRVQVPYVNDYGKKAWTGKSGFATMKEAKQYAKQMELEIEKNGGVYSNKTYTVNDLYEDYMKVVGAYKYSRSTINSYTTTHKLYIKDSIGSCNIKDLHYMQLQKFFNSLDVKGTATCTMIKKILSIVFKYALKNGYVSENPMSMIEIHAMDTSKKTESISEEDFNKIIEWILTDHAGHKVTFNARSKAVALYLGYYLGLRKGEALALEKNDVDFVNNTVNIDKRLEYQNLKNKDYYVTHDMKTKSSKAVLPLPKPLKMVLQEWFEINPNELVCCNDKGDYLTPMVLDSMIRIVSKNMCIDFRYHSLRHSYATNIVLSGVDVKTASKLCRHSNIQTTLNIYADSNIDAMQDAINHTFNNDFSKNSTKTARFLENKPLN